MATEGTSSFEHLFSPLVTAARERLRRRVEEPLYGLLTVRAHSGWERYLLKRLCSAGKKVADEKFRIFCTSRAAFASEFGEREFKQTSAYREFIGDDPALRLHRILDEFPGLVLLCETLIENWVDAVREFLARLNTDLAELPFCFAGGPFVCPIDELQAGLSDPHRGGRCVVRLVFPGSISLIYKPRSLSPEAQFSTLLELLNARQIPHALRWARCWDRGEYGWMEEVAPQSCNELAALHAFYWRAGALLALIYLSRGVDMHKENVIADGAFPIFIDLETLWHPQEHIDAEEHPTARTVLRTGLLPQTNPLTGVVYEQNGLGHKTGQNLRGSRHLPMFAQKAHPAPGFLPDILAGFRWIGRQVFEERQQSGKFRLRVQSLARCRRRRILRPTAWYQSVIERMIAPPSLRSAERIAAECMNIGQRVSPITEDEWSALMQMDVPYIEQTAKHKSEQGMELPVQSIEAFLEQEAVIIDAFTPAANGSSL